MDKAIALMEMGQYTKDIGKMVCDMGEVDTHLVMEQYMMESGSMTKCMDKAFCTSTMETELKRLGTKGIDMEQE